MKSRKHNIPIMKRFFYMLALCLSCSSVAQAGDIWVSPAGNDNHRGRAKLHCVPWHKP